MNNFFVIVFSLSAVIMLHGADTDTVKINSIHFIGNENFTESTLHSLMSLKQSSWFTSNYFNNENFIEDLESIKSFYLQEGFPNFKVEDYNLLYNDERSEVDITIYLNENNPVEINLIRIEGNRYLQEYQILEKLNIQTGERYQQNNILRGKSSIKKMYLNEGYLNCNVNLESVLNENENKVDLIYDIDEGERFIINDIKIEGLKRIKKGMVLRELEFARDQFVNLGSIAISKKKLYHTSFFKSVIINPVPTIDSAESKKDILIKLVEDNQGLFDLAVGFGTIEKFRVFSEVTYNNFLGLGYRAALNGKLSTIEKKLESSITDPWILGIPWNLGLVGNIGQREEPSFSFSYAGGELNFFREFLDRSRFIIGGSYHRGFYDELKYSLYEENDIEHDFTPEEQQVIEEILKNLDITIHRTSLKAALLYDLRDNLFNPSKGFSIDFTSEFIYGVANADYLDLLLLTFINRILRTQVIGKYFYPIDNLTTIASSLEIGVINNFSGSQVTFLLNDLFYAGGPNSIRGFGYQLVGPLAENNVPTGGQFKLVWNLFELRRHIVWIIDAVAFFDLGNVWAEIDGFRFSDLRYSPGLGLRIGTPIGLARLDYGFNPWPTSGEDSGQLWFGIGHAF